jgi:hypothetical protein
MEFNPKYKMLQEVYHVTPESPKGVIINIRYSIIYGIDYNVTFGVDSDVWCYEHELTTERSVI